MATEIYSGDDFVLFEISALDENAYAVPTACDDILVTSEKGTVVGLGNGNPADISDYNLCEISLFSGKALAIVAKDKDNQAAISLSLKSVK
ncbi:hypothetical protein HSISB1_2102 [Streptococcus sp. HSISB1]|nr:hypothetical protein HSISB1_2102 [Streptococcus sp. HSISB1]